MTAGWDVSPTLALPGRAFRAAEQRPYLPSILRSELQPVISIGGQLNLVG